MPILPQISKTLYKSIKNAFNSSPNSFECVWRAHTKYFKGAKVKYFDVVFECKEDHMSSDDFNKDSKYWKYPSKMYLMK